MANKAKEVSKDLGKVKNIHDLEAFKLVDGDQSNPAMLVSRLDHSALIAYNGEAMMVPPRGKLKIGNHQKLGALPKGVQLIK